MHLFEFPDQIKGQMAMETDVTVDVPSEVQQALRYGRSWHGHLPSACCECDMISWWRQEIAAGRAILR